MGDRLAAVDPLVSRHISPNMSGHGRSASEQFFINGLVAAKVAGNGIHWLSRLYQRWADQ